MFSSMKVLSRQLTVDLYNCKTSMLGDTSLIQEIVKRTLINLGYSGLSFAAEEIEPNHFAIVVIHSGGHVAMHIFKSLAYVSADVYLCHESAEPEEIYKQLRSFFKPEKMKTTFLKRGDFGREKEVKPKINTKVAPLRKIHNTGVKVVRVLSRRNNDT